MDYRITLTDERTGGVEYEVSDYRTGAFLGRLFNHGDGMWAVWTKGTNGMGWDDAEYAYMHEALKSLSS